MKILVCGGRNYDRYDTVLNTLKAYGATTVVEGGAKGADELARRAARAMEIPCLTHPAKWGVYGKVAGIMRNGLMLDYKPDLVLVFPGGSGTRDMAQQAENRSFRVAYVATPGPG